MNIKNVFYSVMLDILILQKNILRKLKKTDKKVAEELNYDGVELPLQEKDFSKIEVKSNIYINVFCYENELLFLIYISKHKFEDSMDFLLLINDDKSHYVYIKDFNRFVFYKTKNKNEKWFCKSCLRYFSKENVLIKHKEDCLSINGKKTVQLDVGTIKFKIISNKYLFPLKFMLILSVIQKVLKVMKVPTLKNIMIMFLVALLTKLFVLMINLVSQLLFIEVKMQHMNLLKQFLKSISTKSL